MFPVLLIPGVDDTSARMDKLRTGLQARGFAPVLARGISPSDASIAFAEMGQQVQDKVIALQQQTGAAKVDIVAYSMGALAVRYFLHRLDGCSRVRRFISLAGPHHGTLTAYLRQNAGCRQMRPGSLFVRELQDVEGQWGAVKVFSFWSPWDLMILPATSSVLAEAQNRTFNVLVHQWISSDRRVIEAVAQTLDAPD